MIGYLSGTVFSKLPGQIILKVSGVGYVVNVPTTLLNSVKLTELKELFIHSHIREDAFDLYGFLKEEEINLFRLVMTVSGIGPKTALLILDRGVENTEKAIKDADLDFFTNIPRLGRKNAQKVIIELKDKLGSLKELDLTSGEENSDAIEALRSMGYTKNEAVKVLSTAPKELTLEEKIKYGLKYLGKNNG